MATKFNVTFDDGSTVSYTVKPKHILKVEREGGSLEATVESSYRLAYLASGSDASFEDWLDNIEDITPDVPAEESDANPT